MSNFLVTLVLHLLFKCSVEIVLKIKQNTTCINWLKAIYHNSMKIQKFSEHLFNKRNRKLSFLVFILSYCLTLRKVWEKQETAAEFLQFLSFFSPKLLLVLPQPYGNTEAGFISKYETAASLYP